MSASFTPGPWWGGCKDSPWYVRRESDDACIAHMEDGGHSDPNLILIDDDEREANARLIAASPDGLELAQDAIPILEVLLEEREEAIGEECEILRDLLARTKAFVAKARGGAA